MNLDERLTALERRLADLERMLASLSQVGLAGAQEEAIKSWVTDYVSLRLQQLVPESCEPTPPSPEVGQGHVLPGTGIRCTEEVLHRLGRIPIPFVRQMVTRKVADTARAEGIALVDVAVFERAATF